MANEQQTTNTATGSNSASEGQKECSSDWMYLYDAFRSNEWTCICNSDISNPGER